MANILVFAIRNRHPDSKFKRMCKRISDLCLLEVVGGRTNKNYIVLHVHTDYSITCVKCVWLVLEFRASANTGQVLSKVLGKQILPVTKGG